MTWVVVVPVKGTPGAKARLRSLPDRAALADAFALDTVAALVAASVVERVVVVTADAELGARLAALGAVIVPEMRAAEGDPLNAAIVQGADAARGLAPTAHLAIVTADLPALTPSQVEGALQLAERFERSMVPDTQGTGTTMLLARAGVTLTPQFGPGSRAAHEATGHVPLMVAAGIRRDVDTPEDLQQARVLGVGRHTGALSRAETT